MRLRFREARLWRYVVAAIAEIIEEGKFRATPDGLSFRALDSSGTAMVELMIPRGAFEEYEVSGEEAFGVNFEDFSKVVKAAAKGDEMLLETVGGRLGVTFKGHGTRTFALPNIEISEQEVPELALELPVRAKIMPAIFKDVVKEVEMVSDVVKFEVPAEQQALHVRGSSDVVQADIELTVESGALLEFSAKEPAAASYNLEYLSEMAKVSPVAEGVVLEFGSGVPLKLLFELPQGGRLAFYVSPRLE